jgi:hypothetical protein
MMMQTEEAQILEESQSDQTIENELISINNERKHVCGAGDVSVNEN